MASWNTWRCQKHPRWKILNNGGAAHDSMAEDVGPPGSPGNDSEQTGIKVQIAVVHWTPIGGLVRMGFFGL